MSDFRKAWDSAFTAASKPGLLFHDLRRSAIRNMVRSGVPELVAMMISGHKTRSVFDRYNIVSQDDLKEAALKCQQFTEKQDEQLQNSYNPPQKRKKGRNVKRCKPLISFGAGGRNRTVTFARKGGF